MYCFQTFSFQNKRICNEEHDNNPNNISILLRLNEYIQETKIKKQKKYDSTNYMDSNYVSIHTV